MAIETKLRIHNIIDKAALKFGSEAWVLKERDKQRLEIQSLSRLLGISKLDRERNQSVWDKMGVQNTVLEIQRYQQKWLQYLERMDINRILKQALSTCKPKGRRNTGRPKKN